MALEIRIEGAAKLHRVAAQMRAEGNKGLTRQMTKALTDAAEPVKRSIRRSAASTMPDEGGYSAVFDRSLRFKTRRSSGGSSATVNLITFADGTSHRRDITALEAGRLRHPVYGRSRPGAFRGQRHVNPWSVTSIRAGFHRRGTEDAMDEAQKQMVEVIEDYAHRLISE